MSNVDRDKIMEELLARVSETLGCMPDSGTKEKRELASTVETLLKSYRSLAALTMMEEQAV